MSARTDPLADEKRATSHYARHAGASARLGVRGVCDVVEFTQNEAGVPIVGREGKWLPAPVEYKHGDGAAQQADALQLCVQAMCLEDMLCCRIEEGFLFYGQTRRRTCVSLTKSCARRCRRC
jgi:CRISPR-associated exonuclease Cas4